MEIDEKQLEGKPKKIGELKGKPVFHLKTKGGYHIIATKGSKGTETLGVGAHIGLARAIAEKNESDLQWTGLSKSEHVPAEAFEFLMPKYEAITQAFRDAERQ